MKARPVVALFIALLPVMSVAKPVHVTSGMQTGQGTVFPQAGWCLIVTAAHVAGLPGSEVEVADLEANVSKARVIASDPELDVALLRVNKPDPRVCRSANSGRLLTVEGQAALLRGSYLAWIDRIPTPRGGMERIILRSEPTSPNRPRYTSILAGEQSAIPQQGTSGAALWMTDQADPARYLRTQKDRQGHLNGIMAGMHLGYRDGKYLAVKADVIYEFVAQTVQPIDWPGLQLEPKELKIVRRWRGNPPTREKAGYFQTFTSALTGGIAIDFDLGTRDNYVKGVRIQHDDGDSRPPSLMVWTSQFAPSADSDVKWLKHSCLRLPAAMRKKGVVACEFNSVRNARSLRVLFSKPSLLQKIEVSLD